MKKYHILIATALWLVAVSAFAVDANQLQQQWEHIKYEMNQKSRLKAYAELLTVAEQAKANNHAKDAAVYAWSGIINATYAGEKGGLGALKYAKAAKEDLETALDIDGAVLQGAAYNTLGTLYYKVPGWPVGFGDHKKAKSLLKKALALSPNGIDTNFFYGEYLRDSGDYQTAQIYYEKALAAPARPNRPLADKGRRIEIEQAMSEIKDRL